MEWGPASLEEEVNIAPKLICGVTQFAVSQVHKKINTYHISMLRKWYFFDYKSKLKDFWVQLIKHWLRKQFSSGIFFLLSGLQRQLGNFCSFCMKKDTYPLIPKSQQLGITSCQKQPIKVQNGD